jgi:hypothetical protein
MTRFSGTSVEQRVRAAIRLHSSESPGVPFSISAVCRSSGVSRANLYSHHTELLEEIRAVSRPTPLGRRKKPSGDVRSRHTETIAELARRNKALLYLCIEQKLEIRSLRRRLQEVRRSRTTSKPQPGSSIRRNE